MKLVPINRFKIHKKELLVYYEEQLDEVASFAFDIIKQNAMISYLPDGEDSHGRQRYCIPSPEEFVDRAFAIAEYAYAKARETGHLIKAPPLEEMLDQSEDE